MLWNLWGEVGESYFNSNFTSYQSVGKIYRICLEPLNKLISSLLIGTQLPNYCTDSSVLLANTKDLLIL